MQTIEKKILPDYFQAILDGKKKYELRLNEFEIDEGDTLRLREIDPSTRAYTGREASRKVTYVGKFKLGELEKFYTKEEIAEKGLQIISLE